MRVNLGVFKMRNFGLKQQSGAVLAIGLIMLLLLTLIGLTGTRVTGLEEKMAGNNRDRNLAFQAAESALKAGEAYLGSTTPLPAFDCTNGLYPYNGTGCAAPNVISTTAPLPSVWENINWSTYSVAYSGALGISVSPRYIIEQMPCVDANNDGDCSDAGVDQNVYRITARATGATADSVVMLQSILEIAV